ncbi:MAG: TAXI family TRAP transporter solute-binding subunit [Polyangiaceae bacterium]|nr:TAXI family TRAP transporter solute-binding subunit [Polyangiaceae bacterium]
MAGFGRRLRQSPKLMAFWIATSIVAIIVGVVVWLSDPPPPRHVRIATGDEHGAYFEYGGLIARDLQRRGVRSVDVQPTKGSVENLGLLADKRADVAFVHGGSARAALSEKHQEELRSIASIYSEPIWLFHRADEKVRRLSDYRPSEDGKRRTIGIGLEGSGTRVDAIEILRIAGITEDNTNLVALDPTSAAAALERGELDATFESGSPTSPIIQSLLRMPGVKLLGFSDHRAYTKRLPHLTAVEVDRALLSVEDDLPKEPLVLLATRATLVVRKDTHPRIVELLLMTAKERFGPGNLLDPPDTFPSSTGLELEQHPAARLYMAEGQSWMSRHISFNALLWLDRLKLLLVPIITVLLPAAGLAPKLLGVHPGFVLGREYEKLREYERRVEEATDAATIERELEAVRAFKKGLRDLAVKMPRSRERIYELRRNARLVEDEATDRLVLMRRAEAGDLDA